MEKADGLSKRLDWQERVKNNNKDQMLIKPGWIKRVETLVEENDLRNKIRKAQEEDERVVKVVEELKKVRIKMLRDKEQTIKEEVVIKEG